MVLATGQATMPAIREVLTRELEQAPIDCVSAFCVTCRQCRWIANHPTYSEACTEAADAAMPRALRPNLYRTVKVSGGELRARARPADFFRHPPPP